MKNSTLKRKLCLAVDAMGQTLTQMEQIAKQYQNDAEFCAALAELRHAVEECNEVTDLAPVRIVIEVEGGVVQAVYASSESISYDILDRDDMEATDAEHNPEEAKVFTELAKEIETLFPI